MTPPLLRQLPFAGVTIAVAAGVLLYAPDRLDRPGLLLGLAVAAGATLLAALAPWERLPRTATVVVPLTDMLAIALLDAAGLALSVLLVLPVLWLATGLGARCLTVGLVAATLAAWGPDHLLGRVPVTAADVGRLVVLPAVLTAVGIYLHLAERRSRARRDLLATQSQRIAETLTAAREQQRLLDAILNTIDVGVVALSATGRITSINRAHALAAAGRLRVGDHVTATPAPRQYAADGVTPLRSTQSPLVRAWRGEVIDRELIWWEHGPGRPRTAYRISADQLTGADGSPRGAVVVYQDLTAEMAALAQREDFVSSVSHELRTPLTSVLGYLELAAEDPALPAAVAAHLTVAQRNADRLLRLISDLLTAAGTRAGAVELATEDVDLAEVVAATVQDLGPRAATAGVRLRASGGPLRVRGDRLRLRQVLDNVVTNAVKYSRPGDEVEVGLDGAGPLARVRITDTGIGIAPEEQAGLFERFYRAPSVRQSRIQGTGLGLHISHQIVTAHGGTMDLTSAPGVGTEVLISLPRPAPEAAR